MTGARGIGKTFNVLDYYIRTGRKFLLLRRTDAQVQECKTATENPFKAINEIKGNKIIPASIGAKSAGFYNAEDFDGVLKPSGAPLGYLTSLDALTKARGVDYSDVTDIFFDEFIKAEQERSIKNEASALFNCYETVNRNRELNGKPPVKLICASNSNDLANPLYVGLNLVTKVEEMLKKGQQLTILDKKRCAIIHFKNSEISERKRRTALYQLTKGTQFNAMALDNSYNINHNFYKSRNLNEYNPVVNVGELYIYSHKSDGGYYVSPNRRGTFDSYELTEDGIRAFKNDYGYLAAEYSHCNIDFETYYCEALLLEYFKS